MAFILQAQNAEYIFHNMPKKQGAYMHFNKYSYLLSFFLIFTDK